MNKKLKHDILTGAIQSGNAMMTINPKVIPFMIALFVIGYFVLDYLRTK